MIPAIRISTVERPRLLTELDWAANLVIVAAPAGFGKTVLLTQWATRIRNQGTVVHWHTCLRGRAAVTLPDLADNLGLMAEHGQAEDALLGWAHALSAPTVIIIDDTPSTSAVNLVEFMSRMLVASANLRCVVAGRIHPEDLPFGDTPRSVLRQADLAFQLPELRDLAQLLGVTDVGRITGVAESLGRWPLGMRAALVGDAANAQTRLAAGIYYSLDSELGRSLLRVMGKIPRLSARLYSSAFNVPSKEVAKALSDLISAGYVVVAADTAGPYYSVLPGLIPWLQTLREPAGTQKELEELRRLQANVEADLDPGFALRELVSLGAFEDAEQMALPHFSALLADADKTLTTLRYMTLRQQEDYPLLLMMRLILERPNQSIPISVVEKMAAGLHASIVDMESSGDLSGVLVRGTMQIAVERMLGMWESATDLSWQLFRLREEPDRSVPGGTNEAKLSPIGYAVVSLTGLLAGDFTLAGKASQRGYQVAKGQKNILEQVHALSLQALNAAFLGDALRAREILEEVRDLELQNTEPPPEFSWVDGQLARAFTAHHLGETDKGLSSVEKLLPTMDRMEQWPLVVAAESLLVRQKLGADEALASLRSRLEARPPARKLSPFWEVYLGSRLVELATWSGRYRDAERALDRIDVKAERGGVTSSLPQLARARLQLFSGDSPQAAATCQKINQLDLPLRVQTDLTLIHAVAAYGAGDTAAAQKLIDEVTQISDREDFLTIVTGVPYALLTEVAADLGATKLLNRLDQIPPSCRTQQYGLLSGAEMAVLIALAEEKSMVATADDLFISPNTLKTHRRSIYAKLHASSRAEALTTARQLGLI